MISFEKLKLRPMRRADLRMVLDWRNSEKIRRLMLSDRIILLDEHENWYSNSINDHSCEYLIALYEDKPIGAVLISDIKSIDGTCTWGMYIEEKKIGLGIGVLMEISAIDRMFYTHKVRKIWGKVLSSNRILYLHKRVGFSEEGVLKKHIYRDRDFEDVILVSLFSHEWESKRANIMKYLNLTNG